MKNPWLFRLAILLALGTLFVITEGAMVTPGVPLPSSDVVHRIASIPVTVLTLVVTIWLIFADKRPYGRTLGWITLAIAIVLDSIAHTAVRAMMPRSAGLAHATLAPLFLSAVIAIAVVTSPAWSRGPELVSDYGWPSNRSLAIVTPILVVLQIALGAAFRQNTLTLLPHVLGAMFVALVILIESVFVLQQFATHRALPIAAKTLLGVAFGQVFLGITALIMKSMAEDTAPPVIAAVTAHVTGGSLTLAATIVLSILIRRNVQPRAEDPED